MSGNYTVDNFRACVNIHFIPHFPTSSIASPILVLERQRPRVNRNMPFLKGPTSYCTSPTSEVLDTIQWPFPDVVVRRIDLQCVHITSGALGELKHVQQESSPP
ncbi:hypothetical protein VTK73DRAFT_1985 [Phialemonium thermophilum]|uniref:Uncharacterized protein n=1 Tax=Phialemonium thermophilum TaxID=223376 RepID=A0ABR3X6Z3_9PEZI